MSPPASIIQPLAASDAAMCVCATSCRHHIVPQGQQPQLLLLDRRSHQAPLQSVVLPLRGVVVNREWRDAITPCAGTAVTIEGSVMRLYAIGEGRLPSGMLGPVPIGWVPRDAVWS